MYGLFMTQLVPVEVVSIILQSLEGVQTAVDPSNSSSYTPQLVNLAGGDSAICNNVVLQVRKSAQSLNLTTMSAVSLYWQISN